MNCAILFNIICLRTAILVFMSFLTQTFFEKRAPVFDAYNAHMQASCMGCMVRVRSVQQVRRTVAIGVLFTLPLTKNALRYFSREQ